MSYGPIGMRASAPRPGRYSNLAVLLHWSIAALIVFQLLLGWRMQGLEGGARGFVLQLHKLFGLIILILTLIRLISRLVTTAPPLELKGSFELALSRAVHWAFYLAMVALPLSGWAMVSLGTPAQKIFGSLRWPRLPMRSLVSPDASEAVSNTLGDTHLVLVWLILALLALHLAGALRHQFLSRDGVLRRMAVWARPGRVFEPRLLAIPLAAFVLLAVAYATPVPAPLAPRSRPADLAQADVYRDVIGPVLIRRCGSCHDDNWGRGGLSLASYPGLMQGGVHGRVINIAAASDSMLIKRVSLSNADPKFMPRDGRAPLSADQVQILSWWIGHGAPSTGTVASLRPPLEVEAALNRMLGFGDNQIAGGSAVLRNVPPADPGTITALENAGFVVRAVASDSHLLNINRFARRPISDDDVAKLALLREQTQTLDLPDAGLTDAQFARLGRMPSLRSLRVEGNPITDTALSALGGSTELQSLNLYGTKITDAGLGNLSALKKLDHVYVWGTAVTSVGVERFKRLRPDAAVILELSSVASHGQPRIDPR